MASRHWTAAAVCVALAAVPSGSLSARSTATRATVAAQASAVPSDLKPLLTPRASEMRLVVQRYNADRATLSSNYAGGAGGGRGGGRGTGGGAPAAVLSPGRIARLKRFDLDWQAALARLDASKLTPPAKTDLDTLKGNVQANLGALEAETTTLARATTAVPFMPKLVQLIEARIRIEDMNAEKAASTLNDVTKEIAALKSKLEAGLSGAATPGAMQLPKDIATSGDDAVAALRAGLSEWFGFYNGYDPMFTWWMTTTYKKFDTALQDYGTLLRDRVAPANQAVAINLGFSAIPPAPAPTYADVPDLQEILALSQDEMSGIVQRFLAGAGGGRGRGAGAADGVTVDTKYYSDWLTALKTLDFDALSRNAQVDYLYLKRTSEARVARAGMTLPANPPRKTDNSGIPGAARGRQGLLLDLGEEMIPYSPEQLIALANKEFAWCEEEMKKASRQLGFGDDWKKAVEHTKQTYVPPGGQPAMIRDLLFEAIDYLRANDLVSVPSVAAESLHMIMMTPQQQLSSPFFLGGAQILVSYPTDTMDFDARMQSMRGNNPGFSHATAFHEMIPGHNLVGFIGQRFSGYRANLGASTPFFGEGWPLYWELTLYDMGFDKTPEQKVGALFWRMHRCARIIFSLNFHMGLWSPQECIDFLVEKVGHERDNATAEVRRSFQGGYGPLYQAAYLLGGLELRGLRKELVDSKLMTNRQFHDEILRQGSMPIALLRLALTKQKLTRDMNIDWKFYGELPTQ